VFPLVPLRRLNSRRGFTIIELTVVVFVVGVLVVVVASLLIEAINTSAYVRRRNEVNYSLQQGVERMVDGLRANDEVTEAGDDYITVVEDGAKVSYYFDSGSGKLYRDEEVLAEDVSAVKLVYYDADGAETVDEASIRSMDVIIYGEVQGEDWIIRSNVSFRRRPH